MDGTLAKLLSGPPSVRKYLSRQPTPLGICVLHSRTANRNFGHVKHATKDTVVLPATLGLYRNRLQPLVWSGHPGLMHLLPCSSIGVLASRTARGSTYSFIPVGEHQTCLVATR